MEYNRLLFNAIVDETKLKNSDGQFVWITEYLGYLPFGQYQWLEINNEDISNNFEFYWDYNDLVKLNELGLLIKISEENLSDDNKRIKYKINV